MSSFFQIYATQTNPLKISENQMDHYQKGLALSFQGEHTKNIDKLNRLIPPHPVFQVISVHMRVDAVLLRHVPILKLR